MRRHHWTTLLLATAFTACTIPEKAPATIDTGRAVDTSAASVADSVPLVTIPANPPESLATADSATPPASTWMVSETGIGPVRAGMTIAQANTALGGILNVPARLSECDYVKPKATPQHVAFMVNDGRIARVDIGDSSSITTTAGARIGDTEARIKTLYRGRVTSQPHKYTDGRYLVVTPANPTDSAFRIVFETDGKKVLRYRSGIRPAVEYVEGCS